MQIHTVKWDGTLKWEWIPKKEEIRPIETKRKGVAIEIEDYVRESIGSYIFVQGDWERHRMS
jgi:hypothetical protein